MNPEWFGYMWRDPKAFPRMVELAEKPLKDITSQEVKSFSNSKMLKEVDRAARRPYCDWELTERCASMASACCCPMFSQCASWPFSSACERSWS